MAVGAVAVVAAVASACGADSSAVETDRPLQRFAPLVVLDAREDRMPMAAGWFLDRAALWFADDEGCGDRRVARGAELRRSRSDEVELGIEALGRRERSYWRESDDARCEARNNARHYADEHTRPFDADARAPHLRPTEGFYLDLADGARRGPSSLGRAPATVAAPAYAERRPVDVDGERGLHLTYWLLFGADEPRDRDGAPIASLSREGDWERVDVLLAGDDGEYEPVRLRIHRRHGPPATVPWTAVKRASGGAMGTHPVLHAARGSHALYPRPGRHATAVPAASGRPATVVDEAPVRCRLCPLWRTWTNLRAATAEPWYGFGGAWGEVGTGSHTTGPTGPHRGWATGNFQ